MKKPRTFPYEFRKNGRVGKIYHAKRSGNFKTYFWFGGGAKQNMFASFDAAFMFLDTEFSKLDTDQVNSISLNPLRHSRNVYSELEQLLREHGDGATLRDAVNFYIAYRKHKKFLPRRVSECIKEYLAAQKANNISDIQLKTLEKHCKRHAEHQ